MHLTGIGPVFCAWKAHILPLNYRCDGDLLHSIRRKEYPSLNALTEGNWKEELVAE